MPKVARYTTWRSVSPDAEAASRAASAAAVRVSNGVSPTMTSSMVMTKPASTSRVSKPLRSARVARASVAMDHGILIVLPSAQRGDLACGAKQQAQRVGAPIRVESEDDEQQRRQQERAGYPHELAHPRREAGSALQEHAHIGIADGIGALERPLQACARRRHGMMRASLVRPGEARAFGLRALEEVAVFAAAERERRVEPGRAQPLQRGPRDEQIARTLQHVDRSAGIADV